jgi:hypothetical protein
MRPAPDLEQLFRRDIMNKLLVPVLAATLAISASTAYAGGPVIVEEEPEVVAESPASGMILPLLLVGIALCVALCGGDDDPVPPPAGTGGNVVGSPGGV